jgi:hypothetical protein
MTYLIFDGSRLVGSRRFRSPILAWLWCRHTSQRFTVWRSDRLI